MNPCAGKLETMRNRGDDALAGLRATLTDGVTERVTERFKYAHDASHYRMVPRGVATPRSAGEVASLLRAASLCGPSLTFRSGGTSLSGQSSSDQVLVDVRRHFRGIEVLDGGARVRVEPGATVRAVNARLARFGRKLGPDPASEIACTIGGVVANNSSGMACGTHANTYRTLESMVLVLPSGTVIDTGAGDADEALRRAEPALHAGLGELRDRVRGNAESVATVERLFSLKNTMGYGINSFLDFDRPVDLLAHLVIGSEGTLAFVAEATFRTVPLLPHALTGLAVFPGMAEATASVPALVGMGFATVELLDATSLRVSQQGAVVDPSLARLEVRDHVALLVELQASSAEELTGLQAVAADGLAQLPVAGAVELTGDLARRAELWVTRKGLYTAVARNRPSGTMALLEDIAVPVGNLAVTGGRLTGLFREHGYDANVIFGHAKDGNLHFMLTEQLDRPEMLARYLAFTEDMVSLVLGQSGTLKAEHGTGRAMAPYVRRQYGDELYDVMVQLKRLVDPVGVLNPGVLLDEDPDAHVAGLKTAPSVEIEVDRCVECGYCEPVCPSKDLTTTPRQRIVLRREIARAEAAGDVALARELAADYQYEAVDTCAVDGLCATACPVLIDTGDLTRRLRAEEAGRVESRVWNAAARHWAGATWAAGAALTVADRVPEVLPSAAAGVARAVVGRSKVPGWSADLPGGGARRLGHPRDGAVAVHFPACIGAMFGPAGELGVSAAFEALCERAGVVVSRPERIDGLCCGTPWKSKGFTDGLGHMRGRVHGALLEATDGGRLPVIVDATSCTEGLTKLCADTGIQVIDAVEFVAAEMLPLLPAGRRLGTMVVHPTCSTVHTGSLAALRAVADRCAEEVVVPDDWGCCGFAGDRGMLIPELTAAATAPEAAAVTGMAADAYVSVNRTCELGMSRATGRQYRHVLEVLEELTRVAGP